jgi:hypothetical protein
MKIENKDQANFYYKKVNELLSEYLDKWNINPINLRKYFKKGSSKYKNFLERNGLSEVKGIERVFDDILDDMSYFKKEYIAKFESFTLIDNSILSLKSALYLNLKEASIDMEKALADYYDTNLSFVTPLSLLKHFYLVEDWDKDIHVYIFDEEDIEIIKNNFMNYFYQFSSKKDIDLFFNLSVNMKNLISFDDFSKKIEDSLDDDKIVEIISSLLNSKFIDKKEKYFIFKSDKF